MIPVTSDNEWEVMHGLSTGIFTANLIPFLKVKVKVMHISAINILDMATDRVTVTIANKWQVMYGISIGVTIFDLGQF